ncbi:hypothetical protein PF002_g6176 [Phytophthora fragariae]|uniref:Uncharacterized protein n=1 Tax=Phytophthora fragariae TaxID=53985 RepID=A0A6A4A2N1_9STRA|nr:hypothetical protein PF003_g27916 [Phytophthora fragariae]KAE9247640.1 hypothetical protein PF002_g6176 [Phytophthora fragariae]KAE9354177.1 hypothetical protein PF008_g4647 [Phytophthora fragariae]
MENRGGVQDDDDDGFSAAASTLPPVPGVAAGSPSAQSPKEHATDGGAGDAPLASSGAVHEPQPSQATVSSRSGLTPDKLLSLSSPEPNHGVPVHAETTPT